MTEQFKTLYHKGSKGTLYSWKIWTEGADILTEYGQVDGKKQIARKTATPKNLGKTNETTPEEQALSEAQSMWTFKLDRKYKESPDEAEDEEIFLPMLALDFEKRRGKSKEGHTYPCSVQPKLDGVRCLAFWEGNEVKLISRSGKPWELPHISYFLEDFPLGKTMVLDGEVYSHGLNFQQTTRLVKKSRPETRQLKLNVYDIIDLSRRDLQWPERLDLLDKLDDKLASRDLPVCVVQTDGAHNEDRVRELYQEYMSEGYEGAMIRCHDDSEYKFAYRSKRLLKMKSFDDAEFRVIGFKDGVGKFEGAVIWECIMDNGETFEVTPVGSFADRRSYFEHGKHYIGKMLKVKYQGLSESGIVRFPIGLGFRPEEDMATAVTSDEP